jgi:hypothetical protein
VRTFEIFSQIIKTQLETYQLPENSEELGSQKQTSELNRLSSLVGVFSVFLKSSLPNAHESRSLIFQYLSNDNKGLEFIGDVCAALKRFGICVARFQKEYRNSIMPPSRKNTAQLAPQISVEITTNTFSTSNPSNSANTETEEKPKVDPNPPVPAAYSSLSNVYKQLAEIICHIGRSANSTRTRRTPETTFQTDTGKVATELFKGIKTFFEHVEESDNQPFYIKNALPIICRLIFDDTLYPYPMMLSYFYETKCHVRFFEMGEQLLKDDSTITQLGLAFWLSTVKNLVNVESMTSVRSRNDRPPTRDNFVVKDYLAIVQEVKLLSEVLII